jgi:hypothetical protein
MIISGEKYALASEQSVLKEMTQQVLDEEKAKEQARQGKSTKKKEKRKKSTVKPPVEVFKTACFKFIQGSAMDAFMKSLPSDFGQDRLFCMLISQSLHRLVCQWVADGMKMAPPDVMPKIPGMKSILANRKSQVIVFVDTDSEVHHFVASAINVYKKKARKQSKRLANIMKDRRESGKAAKNTHVRNIRMMEEAT